MPNFNPPFQAAGNPSRLRERRAEVRAEQTAIVDNVKAEGRENLTYEESRRFRELGRAAVGLDARIADADDECRRGGDHDPHSRAVRRAQQNHDANGVTGWAQRAAYSVQAMGGEGRALTAGSVDVPGLVETTVVAMPRPLRVIDLLTNRQQIESNSYEYFRQTVRTNNAATVADSTTKPTSVLTVEPVQDRARVHAHLSEPAPVRLWQDNEAVIQWLADELGNGVLDSVERTIISGDGTGENQVGVLLAPGVTQVANAGAGNQAQTLRGAITALQQKGVTPNGWVLSPFDAELIDLAREGEPGGYLLDGYQVGNGRSGNVFGETMPRVVSPSMPQGTAVLADWSKAKLYVREDVRLDVDMSGVLFTKNQFIARAEMRVGVAVLQPSAFAIVDLTP